MDVDVVRLIVECGLVMVAASFAYAFYERKAICDDLRDEIEGADDALRDARKNIRSAEANFDDQRKRFDKLAEKCLEIESMNKTLMRVNHEFEELCAKQRDEIVELKRRKGKPMPCKGKKIGKKVKR